VVEEAKVTVAKSYHTRYYSMSTQSIYTHTYTCKRHIAVRGWTF